VLALFLEFSLNLKNCISNLKINADHFVLTDHHTNVLLNINSDKTPFNDSCFCLYL